MFTNLSAIEMEELINQQLIGRLGCYADDTMYIVPISYAYDGKYIYCRTFNGRKIEMMRKNPKVCFQVDNTRNLSNWKSVICWGEYEELTAEKDRQLAIQQLTARTLPINSSETMHITPEWPFMPDDLNDIQGIFFRIKLTEKTGRSERISTQLFQDL